MLRIQDITHIHATRDDSYLMNALISSVNDLSSTVGYVWYIIVI